MKNLKKLEYVTEDEEQKFSGKFSSNVTVKIRLFPFDSCLLDFVSVTLAMHVTLTLPGA